MTNNLLSLFMVTFFSILLCLFSISSPAQPLSTQDFRISPEEEKLITALKLRTTQPNPKRKNILKELDLIANPIIQEKWKEYLKEVLNSSLSTEQEIYDNVYQKYLQSIVAYEAKTQKCHSNEIKDFSWLNSLKSQFGEKYFNQHYSEIIKILFNLSKQREWECLEQERKTLLQAEWQYKSVQKSLLEDIAEFYESDILSDEEKQQMKPQLKDSRTYLYLLNKIGMAELIFSIQDHRMAASIKRFPAKLVAAIITNPLFSRPFILDFSQLLKKQKH